MEGDASAGAWFEGRECDVGGLDEGYGVPDVSCEETHGSVGKKELWKINVFLFSHQCLYLLSPWQRRGPTVYCASELVLLVSPMTTLRTGR